MSQQTGGQGKPLSRWMLGRALGVAGVASTVMAVLLMLPISASAYDAKLKRYPYRDRRRRDVGDGQLGDRPLGHTGAVKWGKFGQSRARRTRRLRRGPRITVNSVSAVPVEGHVHRATLTPSTATASSSTPGPRSTCSAPMRPRRSEARFRLASATPFSFAVFGDWGEVLNADGTNPQSDKRDAAGSPQAAPVSPSPPGTTPTTPATRPSTATCRSPARTAAPSSDPASGRWPALRYRSFRRSAITATRMPSTSSTGLRTSLSRPPAGATRPTRTAVSTGRSRGPIRAPGTRSTPGTRASTCSTPPGRTRNVGNTDLYENDYDYHWAPATPAVRVAGERPRDQSARRSSSPSSTSRCTPTTPPSDSDTYLQGAGQPRGPARPARRQHRRSAATPHTYQRNLAAAGGRRELRDRRRRRRTCEPIGANGCSSLDAYGIGWSNSEQQRERLRCRAGTR